MNLVIDQGNTLTKLALFDGSNLTEKIEFTTPDVVSIHAWMNAKVEKDCNAILASVAGEELDIPTSALIKLTHETPIPIANKYRTPETLGLDRLANAVGAWSLRPEGNSLVIDAGTCIKYDLVSAQGEYQGGNISPGLSMRFTALNEFTAGLPLVMPAEQRTDFGDDTQTSIIEGVQQGIEHEMRGFVDRYSADWPDLTIFMTGGSINYFDLEFKNSIFAEPNLTLVGLNEILNYNGRT